MRAFLLILMAGLAFTQKLLIPMDAIQTDHLKAYGIAFSTLEKNKNVDWLQIDHIIPVKGKRKGSHTSTIARKIISEELSSDEFQLLCANCNFAKKDLEKCPIDHSLD